MKGNAADCYMLLRMIREIKVPERKCAISSTNVAILLLLFKRAIIAHNKLIDSQHYKRHRERTTREFHSLSHFTLTTTQ